MSKKKKNTRETDGIVYSTNPNYVFADLFAELVEKDDLTGSSTFDSTTLYVSLDKKKRGGKIVTLVEGYTGSKEALEHLGKELKTQCGSGGAAKNGEILVQGDHREQVFKILINKGFKVKKKGG